VTRWRVSDFEGVQGGGPHYVGLFETLQLGRSLGLKVPTEIEIVTVEPADCLTVGGEMTEAVRAAVDPAVRFCEEIVRGWSSGHAGNVSP